MRGGKSGSLLINLIDDYIYIESSNRFTTLEAVAFNSISFLSAIIFHYAAKQSINK